MIKTYYFAFLRTFYQSLKLIENYLSSKSITERIILFSLCWLSLFVPIYFYLNPWNYLAYNQNKHQKSKRAEAKALQASQEQDIMLQELTQHIQNSYASVQDLEQIWQDIISEISTLLLESNIHPQNIKLDISELEKNHLLTLGTSSLSYFLQALNCIERHIPFLHIAKINITPKEQDFSYSMQISKITPQTNNTDTKELLLSYLNNPSFLPPTTPLLPLLPWEISSHPQPSPNFTLQAAINQSIKINGRWLKKNDEIQGFKFIGIQECGVILQSSNQQICLALKKSQ